MNSYSSSLVSTSFKFVFASSRSFWFSPHSRTWIFTLNHYFRPTSGQTSGSYQSFWEYQSYPWVYSLILHMYRIQHCFVLTLFQVLLSNPSNSNYFNGVSRSTKPVFQFRVWFLVEQCSLLDLFYLYVREYSYHHLDFIITQMSHKIWIIPWRHLLLNSQAIMMQNVMSRIWKPVIATFRFSCSRESLS